MSGTDQAFQIILHAGNSRSSSVMAEDAAEEFDFEEAEKQLKEAADELNQAHLIQTELIQEETRGNKVDMNIIMVHAQDHLTMASLEMEHAERFVRVYHEIFELKGGKKQ